VSPIFCYDKEKGEVRGCENMMISFRSSLRPYTLLTVSYPLSVLADRSKTRVELFSLSSRVGATVALISDHICSNHRKIPAFFLGRRGFFSYYYQVPLGT